MFLNTHNGSVILAACSRRELPAGLAFAHRLWDVLVLNGALQLRGQCHSRDCPVLVSCSKHLLALLQSVAIKLCPPECVAFL